MNLKKEFYSLISAIQYFTRIPISKNHHFDFNYNSIVYLPLVGFFIGLLNIVFFYLCFFIIKEVEIAIIFMMIFYSILTGALHEDGFSDFFDGFGGGYNKDQILKIMKDPQIGSFAAISLIYLILLKFYLLKYIFVNVQIYYVIFILVQVLSRWVLLFFIKFLPYARSDGKSKPFEQISSRRFWIFQIIYINLLIIFIILYDKNLFYFLTLFFWVLFFVFIYFKNLLIKKIEGYTGDTLGAIQQISEILLYLLVVLFYKYQLFF